MCYNIIAKFKYANKHEQAGEDRLRFTVLAEIS